MKRGLSRGEKSLIGVCGVVTLGLVAVGWMRANLEAEPDWGIPAAQPTPKPNGYDLYVAAGTAVIKANPPVDPVNDVNIVTDPKIIATQYSLARRTIWMKQNARVWTLFEQAKAADSLCFQNRGQSPAPFGIYGKLRELARCKVIAANTAKMRGDWNEAAKNGLDAIEMGGDIQRGAPLIEFLVGVAIEAIGEGNFRDTPAHLNAKEARGAARRLEKLMQTHPKLVDILIEDKWVGLSGLRQVMQSQQWRRPSTWGLNASWKEKVGSQFLSKREVVENYKRVADWNIAKVQQPYSAIPGYGPKASNIINDLVNPSQRWTRNRIVKFEAVRRDTQLSLLLVRLALRAYRVEKGHYPETLSELAPDYIAKTPLDPFGQGTPIRYKKTGDSYVLWSVGPDGKDDNGKPIPPRGKRKIAMIIPEGVGDAIAIPEWK